MKVRQLYNSDENLLQGLKNAEDKAFEKLYENCYPLIKGIILKNNGAPEDVDDILQEAMIVFYEKIMDNNFQLTCSTTTFIYSICRNLWLKEINKINKTTEFRDTYKEHVEVSFELEDEKDLDKENVLIQALEKLGDRCQQILTYYYYNKLSMEDIANRLGYTNADNAKNQKYKCTQQLKKLAKSIILKIND